MNRKTRVAVLGSLVSIGIAGCGGKSHVAAPKLTTPTTEATTTTTAPPVLPLTGQPASSAAQASQPAVVVKVDDIDAARPQTGIDKADVVYEELVEGGLTRFAAVFQSQYPDLVGPVRSGRLTDEGIVDDLGRPVFAYSGTNAVFLPQLRSQPITDVDDGNRPGQFWRNNHQAVPHNLYTSAAKLATLSEAKTPPPAIFSFSASGATFTGTGVTTDSSLSIPFPQASISWSWNAGAASWMRQQNGTPHTAADGKQLSATNIIVQFVPYQITLSGIEGGSLVQVPTGTLTGTGQAWVLSQGQIVKGNWSRASLTSTTSYTDSAGNPIQLSPGVTWVELVPTGTTVSTAP